MEGNIGTSGHFSLKVEGGKATIAADNTFDNLAGVGVAASVSVPVDALLDKLAAAIPGTFDDALIAIAKEALKKL